MSVVLAAAGVSMLGTCGGIYSFWSTFHGLTEYIPSFSDATNADEHEVLVLNFTLMAQWAS